MINDDKDDGNDDDDDGNDDDDDYDDKDDDDDDVDDDDVEKEEDEEGDDCLMLIFPFTKMINVKLSRLIFRKAC
jgi:hypothetical protein